MVAIGHPRYTVFALIAASIVLFILGFIIGYFTSPDSSDKQCTKPSTILEVRKTEQTQKSNFHEKLYETLSAKEIGKNLKYFSKRPHVGGTPQSKKLADFIAERWKEYGFDKVEQPMYNILLPYVSPDVSNSVQILKDGAVVRNFTGKEKLADPSENDTTMIAPLLGFAKQGEATGTLLYVNYGRESDFKYLKTHLSISDCKGKIVIMRFGKIYRGDKVKHAQMCGAEGAILYNDPKDYAPEGQNKTYPDYIWLPSTGVQRGSIFAGRGDPLTPGLPSIEGVFRISQEEADLPKIPATPMPYGDAVELLKLMEGDEVPASWKGALDITYKLGNKGLKNNKAIKIIVNVPNKRQDVYNVIGTIYGKEEPDRWVLIGNHRDAWGFGAVDASSGTASMMEISRGLKDLLKNGWRPRRTIKFCSWGAEESGLIGSSEWVEENERALTIKGITYINVDISVYGDDTLSLSGSPLLQTFIFEETKKVEDPHMKDGKKPTVYERMVERNVNKTKPKYGKLAAGSDYAAFYQFIGVPSVDMSYAGKVFYPVYHTVHDTYKWLQGLIDPNFVFHLTTTRVASRILMNMADSLVLPLDVTKYGIALNNSLKTLREQHGDKLETNNVTLKHIEKAIKNFVTQAAEFNKDKEAAMDSKSDLQLRDLNDKMVNVEKVFIYPYGLPNRPTTRHIAFAPSSNNKYGTTSFPGISDLLFTVNKTASDWREIKRQASIVFTSITEATQTLVPDAK